MGRKDIHVLYVDDEENNLSSLKAAFRRDYHVYTASSASDGLKILKESKIQVLITDQRMPNMTGIEFLQIVNRDYPDIMRILLTGYTDIEAVIDAINKGEVYRYVTKPWDENDLRVTVENAFEIYSLREDNKKLTQDLIRANKQLEFLVRQSLIS